mmetsp:Transcript_23328/g.54030  ORF Transcript_23328/g.54030 Transcript_23328/m.54030 type:complete len:132 (+) Transcript_23328:190-585(+)
MHGLLGQNALPASAVEPDERTNPGGAQSPEDSPGESPGGGTESPGGAASPLDSTGRPSNADSRPFSEPAALGKSPTGADPESALSAVVGVQGEGFIEGDFTDYIVGRGMLFGVGALVHSLFDLAACDEPES